MKVAMSALALLAVSAGFCGPSFAQTPGNGAPNCLFPLACPGPVPSKPEPLYGPPEDQMAAQPAEPKMNTKHRAHRRVAKKVQ